LDRRQRFPGPLPDPQFVKGKQCTLGHARQKFLQGEFGRFVEVKVQVEHRNDQMRIVGEVFWDRLAGITCDKLDLGNMRKRATKVIEPHRLAQVVKRRSGEKAFRDTFREIPGAILLVDLGKALKGVEADDLAPMVERLINRAELCPTHESAAQMHAAFEDRSGDFQYFLK